MNKKKSMVDVAFDVLTKRKRPLTFSKLWEKIVEELDLNPSVAERKIGTFYSDLMLDNRFASLKDNKWDLRIRRRYDETHEEIDEDKLVENADSIKDIVHNKKYRKEEA